MSTFPNRWEARDIACAREVMKPSQAQLLSSNHLIRCLYLAHVSVLIVVVPRPTTLTGDWERVIWVGRVVSKPKQRQSGKHPTSLVSPTSPSKWPPTYRALATHFSTMATTLERKSFIVGAPTCDFHSLRERVSVHCDTRKTDAS